MAVAVAGLWELGHNVPLTEAELWVHGLRDFGVDEWHMAPVTGIANEMVVEHHSVDAMLRVLRAKYQLVFVLETAPTELADLQHPPEHVCYVFGKANWSPFNNLPQPGDMGVRLATRNNNAGLWPHQCMAAVLWHRGLQWQ